ncbi:hypothetical protein SRABI128_02074 [Microbacterium sp. Bi128]|nr:hypothetical protein SRABI128_02074 [Microbacterium sp. Bi128]
MHALAADELEEDVFEARALALQVRQRDPGAGGEGPDLDRFDVPDREAVAQQLERDAVLVEHAGQGFAVGGVDHRGVLVGVGEILGAALEDQATARDDQQRVDGLLHLGEQVRRHQHRASLFGEVA